MRKILETQNTLLILLLIDVLLLVALLFERTAVNTQLTSIVMVADFLFYGGSQIWVHFHPEHPYRLATNYLLAFDLLLLYFVLLPSFFLPTTATWMGLLFFIIGLVVMFIPRNGIIGVRLPATYNSPVNWAKTNYFSGWVLIVASLLIALFGNIWPSFFGPLLAIILIPFVFICVGYAYHLPNAR